MHAREALARAGRRLRDEGVASAHHDAELLLADVLGVPRGRLGLVEALTEEQVRTFDARLVRRARREPLQHILGTAAFRHVEVEVGPGVFVPRPETEVLAGWGTQQLQQLQQLEGPEAPHAVDLCTGSGVIALALATEVPGAVVHAVEISPTAYDYARRNLAGLDVDLRCGDVATAFADLDGTVDVVVANPPYIPLTAYASVEAEARDFDPPMALWSGHDGLDAIRAVEATAARLLRPGGWVGCEHADLQHESAPQVFATSGRWTGVHDCSDLAGRPRFVTARRL